MSTGSSQGIITIEYLPTDQYLVSPNKQYFAIMQGDGNFVVYKGSGPSAQNGLVWQSNTPRAAGQFYAINVGGYLVLSAGVPTQGEWAMSYWTSLKTPSLSSSLYKVFMKLQDDGKLCSYAGTYPNAEGAVLWCSS
jgi:hypothetical protein